MFGKQICFSFIVNPENTQNAEKILFCRKKSLPSSSLTGQSNCNGVKQLCVKLMVIKEKQDKNKTKKKKNPGIVDEILQTRNTKVQGFAEGIL